VGGFLLILSVLGDMEEDMAMGVTGLPAKVGDDFFFGGRGGAMGPTWLGLGVVSDSGFEG